MLQKFALAFKTKTIEFFAEEEVEEEDDDHNHGGASADLDAAPEEIITGQRVVVLKPDPPPRPNPDALISSLFTGISSFRAAYLHLQAAHSPFDQHAICSADRSAVSHLRRLSDLKRAYSNGSQSQNPNPCLPLSAHLDAEVQENQSLLRTFETVVNRMQSDIDQKDAESAELKQRLRESEATNRLLERRLELASESPEEKIESKLTVGVFNSILKESCRAVHRFTRALIDLMHKSKWDLELAAASIYPNIRYAKSGDCRYAILSYICLAMFESFNSDSFGCRENETCSNSNAIDARRRNYLTQFIEESTKDPLEVMSARPNSDFATFCRIKYKIVINSWVESYLLKNSNDSAASVLGNFNPSNPLYVMFVNMASSMWLLHKLAWAYDPVVEIFQAGRGSNFSMIFMETVCRKPVDKTAGHRNSHSKVGFTVVPGFRVGKTVIQCWVYLDNIEKKN
ncbi:hypothetical protein KSP39_PZI000739 [Platanthera zijinensis]|uniref:DUF641 domain-containing protein n=1 Tax=Platanthera zijinensis TaxID=2320716 RepID=A0AAP0GFI4_9ASPA